MFLNWITQLIKQAVLRGFHEAVAELDLRADGEGQALAEINSRMAIAAPTKDHAAETNGRRKAKA